MRSGPCANTCSAGEREREILAYVLVDWDCAAAAPAAATGGALADYAGSAVLLGGVVAPRRRETRPLVAIFRRGFSACTPDALG